MNLLIVLLLISLLIGAAVGYLISLDAGYVLISLENSFSLETSLWLAATALLLLLGLSLVLGWLLAKLRSPLRWNRLRLRRRARNRSLRGYVLMSEGKWEAAQKLLLRYAERSELPLLNYLAAARAANEQGNNKTADQLLKQAEDSASGVTVAVGIIQAEFYFERHNYEQALASLMQLRKQAPNHSYLLRLLKKVYWRLSDWQQLSKLLPELRKQKILSDTELQSVTIQVYLNWLEELHSRPFLDNQEKTKLLEKLWSEVPKPLRKTPELCAAYAKQLLSLDKYEEAEQLLRQVLEQKWSDPLIELYGLTPGKNANRQLIAAEQWLQERPNNANLLLALGRLSLRNQLWGKAQEYFQASQALRNNAEINGELCRLMAALGDEQKSFDYYKQTINQTLPTMPLPNAAVS